MIFTVNVSEQAEADLRGIFEYIAFELQSPDNAAGQLARLETQIINLEKMPERHRRYEEEPWYSRGMRFLPVDHYLIYYIIEADKQLVTVIRVIYSGRDIKEQFNMYEEF